MSVPHEPGAVAVRLTVNGEVREALAEPRMLLSDFLRERLHLLSIHVSCELGICGACTILVDGRPARACLMLAVQAEGEDLETVEGLAGADLHPLQRAFWEHHALQCGYCTPGMLLTACHLLETNPSPSEAEIREAISGNICRCTGYVQIVQAILAAAGTGRGS
jgi:aerobic-type carbon monoxide dehydrogenase small subunit (CoxS/CutS family)